MKPSNSPRVSPLLPPQATLWPPCRMSRSGSGQFNFILKSTTQNWAKSCSAILSMTSAVLVETGRRSTSSMKPFARCETVGEHGRAICALSGGVDSAVAATLVDRALGSRLSCVFVNNGVLRKNEFQKVQQNLRDKLGLSLVAVD